MQPFEKEVIERLTRVEDKVDVLQKHKDNTTSLKNFTISGVIAAVVSWGLTHGGNPFS